MFDDLHDLVPPRPGPSELAAVAGRARALRRRQAAAWMGVGAVVLVALAGVVAWRSQEGASLRPASTVPGGLPTTGVVTAPPSTTGAVAVTSAPGQSLPASTAGAGATTTTTVPTDPMAAVAITADGDAVLLALSTDGTVLDRDLLLDGADPDEPPVEGEFVLVDSAAATLTDRIYVSTCCEPISGSALLITGSRGAHQAEYAFDGHALAYDAQTDRLAAVTAFGLVVVQAQGTASPQVIPFGETDATRPIDVAWVGASMLAVIGVNEDVGIRLFLVDIGTGAVTADVELAAGLDDVTSFRIAGRDASGNIGVLSTNALVESHIDFFDPLTLEALPVNRTLPAPALSASLRAGPAETLLWVGEDRGLRIGEGALAEGEYVWAAWVP